MSYSEQHPLDMPRSRPAYLAILDLLEDGDWHHVSEVQGIAESASDLAPTSVENLIYWGHRRGGKNTPWRNKGKGKNRLIQIRKDQS